MENDIEKIDLDNQLYLVDLGYKGCPYAKGGKKLECNGGRIEGIDEKSNALYEDLRYITSPDNEISKIIVKIWNMKKETMQKLHFVCTSCFGGDFLDSSLPEIKE